MHTSIIHKYKENRGIALTQIKKEPEEIESNKRVIYPAEEILDLLDGADLEVMKPTDIFRFPPTFWLLSIICLAYYAAIFPFISLGQVFFMKKFMFNKSEANMINGRSSQSISTKYYVVVAF